MSDTKPVANEALNLSESLAAAVETASPSVVQVIGRHRMPSSGLVWSADGIVVTADHTVERDENLGVGLADGRTVEATLVGRDPGTDVAVLRIQASGLAVPQWKELEALKVGHLALALRRNRTLHATFGVVSALGDEGWRTPAGGRLERYVTADFGLQRGFSGSLLVDAAGRAFGLGTAGLARGRSLVIPAVTLRRVVEALLQHGHVPRAYLGVAAHPVRLPANLESVAGQPVALMVAGIQPDSAAEQAGLLLGDLLVSVDGEPLGGLGHLHGLLGDKPVGSEVTLRILRGGEAKELKASLGAR
ncbi:MAG TPA: trypsin-like peptidase domain-containing protein [Thermoanaerobaculia bacterium]|nr:trypsin-like peptidase domain-containing protein [Thermoanaerobaculia bacterium]